MSEIKLSEKNMEMGSTYQEFEKTGDKNLFEEVIDSLMMSKYSDDQELIDYIKTLPNDKKRMAILTLLDGDNNLWTKINDHIQKSVSKMDYIKEVVLMLREFVKVGEVEKKKYGEVMTPMELVKDMLNTLPKEVWSNPDLKWLDPANGSGPFPIMVIYKLMNGLKNWEPDEEKRYKHIVENMIYTCELQDKNVFLWLCAVDPKDEYVTNTYWGSFLEEGFDKHMKEVWALDKFDIVIGNPPYQDGGKTQGKNSSLWTKFIIKSNLFIKDGGYLLFITPSSWMAPSEKQKNDLKSVFSTNRLEVLNTECGKYFSVASTFSYFLIKKSYGDKNLTLINNNFKFNLDKPFLPNIINHQTISICDKFFFSKSESLSFSSGLRNDKLCDNGLYNVWYGSGIKKSNFLGGNYSKKKIIVNKPGYLNPRFDNGLYNTSANNYWVEVENESDAFNLISFFNTKFSSFILEKLCKYSGYNSLGVLKKLPKDLIYMNWTDEKLYEYFNLTEEEINLIESTIK